MADHVIATSDADFEADVLQADTPVLVDFWADWCQPCKMISPIIEEFAKEQAGKVKVVKLNVDDNSATPAKYAIRGIPSLLLFKAGELKGTKVGALSKSQLSAFVDEHL